MGSRLSKRVLRVSRGVRHSAQSPGQQPSHGKTLEDLPTELVLIIFELLLPSVHTPTAQRTLTKGVDEADVAIPQEQLRNLSLTSKRFGSIARSVLYRIVRLKTVRQAAILLQTLTRRPSLCDSVRQIICEISLNDAEVRRASWEEIILRFSGSVPLLGKAHQWRRGASYAHEDHTVDLSWITVNRPDLLLFAILQRCHNLRDLQLWNGPSQVLTDLTCSCAPGPIAWLITPSETPTICERLTSLVLQTNEGSCAELLAYWAEQIMPYLTRLEVIGKSKEHWLLEFHRSTDACAPLKERIESMGAIAANERSFYLLATVFRRCPLLKYLWFSEPIAESAWAQQETHATWASVLQGILAAKADAAWSWNLNTFLAAHADTLEDFQLHFTAEPGVIDAVFGPERSLPSLRRMAELRALRAPLCSFFETLADLQAALAAPRGSASSITALLGLLPPKLSDLTIDEWWPDLAFLRAEGDGDWFRKHNNALMLLYLNINWYNQTRDVPMTVGFRPRHAEDAPEARMPTTRLHALLKEQRQRLRQSGFNFVEEGEYLFDMAREFVCGDGTL